MSTSGCEAVVAQKSAKTATENDGKKDMNEVIYSASSAIPFRISRVGKIEKGRR